MTGIYMNIFEHMYIHIYICFLASSEGDAISSCLAYEDTYLYLILLHMCPYSYLIPLHMCPAISRFLVYKDTCSSKRTHM